MLITELHTKGFTRMRLVDTAEFIIRPTMREQIILGTNGSGKSSLFNELTPLPPNPNDYSKDGFKKITIKQDGITFVITTTFKGGAKTSFMKGNEELNPGGTATVAKELVKEYFGITPAIHELMIGTVRFTDMSPALRREWFTRLATVPYDYAIGVYNKLRVNYRDVSGALKLDKKRLVTEIEKLMPEEDMIRLTNDSKALTNKIQHLQELTNQYPEQRDKTYWDLLCSELTNQRQQASKAVLKQLGLIADLQSYSSLEELTNALEAVKMAANSIETRLKLKVDAFHKMEGDAHLLESASNVNVGQLVEDNRRYHGEIINLEKTLSLNLAFEDYSQTLIVLNTVRPNMDDALVHLPPNADRALSQAIAEQKQALLTEKTNRSIEITNLLNKAHARVETMQHQHGKGEVDCPKCRNRFIPSINPETQKEIDRFITAKNTDLQSVKAEMDELSSWLSKYEEYKSAYIAAIRITRNAPALNTFWDFVLKDDLFFVDPMQISRLMGQLQHDLETMVSIKRLLTLVNNNVDIINQLKDVDATKLNDLKIEMEALDLEIRNMSLERDAKLQESNKLSVLINGYHALMNLRQTVVKSHDELVTATKNAIECIRIDAVRHALEETQILLATKAAAINAAKNQQAVVDSLKTIIEQREVEERTLKILVKELSPTEGLIADGLMGSINAFIKQMNKLIARIWSYSFKIKGCKFHDDQAVDLDYKFPMVVMGKEPPIDDVALGSAGMREIVNLAFKVVAMQYLNMTTHPLKLDEFGAAFDEFHRHNATMTIKQLMEVLPFSQLWMISHYEESFGAFTNAEICVLARDNIGLSIKTNQHVTFQ